MNLLKAEKICKSYGKKEVLKNFNLGIKKSEVLAFVGVNGSGKSTFIEIVCGIKQANSGELTFFGNKIQTNKQRAEIKNDIGYMPQSFCLFADLTVKENLLYMLSVYGIKNKDKADKIIEKCFLGEYSNTQVKKLSGGYKQLLSLATAIIHTPKLLILDEPTSAMDPLFRKRFWQIIKNYKKENKASVLVTTHYTDEIFECDRVVFLSSGKIIHSAKTDNMFESGKFKNINEVLDYYILKEYKNAKN